jgi:hypothetical protein
MRLAAPTGGNRCKAAARFSASMVGATTTTSAKVHKLPRLKLGDSVYDLFCHGRGIQDQSELGRLRLFRSVCLSRHVGSPGSSRGAVDDFGWSEQTLIGELPTEVLLGHGRRDSPDESEKKVVVEPGHLFQLFRDRSTDLGLFV